MAALAAAVSQTATAPTACARCIRVMPRCTKKCRLRIAAAQNVSPALASPSTTELVDDLSLFMSDQLAELDCAFALVSAAQAPPPPPPPLPSIFIDTEQVILRDEKTQLAELARDFRLFSAGLRPRQQAFHHTELRPSDLDSNPWWTPSWYPRTEGQLYETQAVPSASATSTTTTATTTTST